MSTRSLRVGVDDGGARLDVFVAGRTGDSRSHVAARIAAGEVTVDGRPATKSLRLTAGAEIVLADPSRAPAPTPVAMPPVRFADEHLLVVAKPAGLVVHPGSGRPDATLVDALRDAGVGLVGGPDERPGIVHRLDRDTSGLLVVATSQPAYDGLVDALRRRVVHRRYLALTEGVPPRRGRVDAPIARHPRHRTRFAAVADGRPAVTHFEVLGQGQRLAAGAGRGGGREGSGVGRGGGREGPGGSVALTACRLETGRTHQIRVHLAYAGHPVAGDLVYGADADLAAALGLERPFLHAAELGFDHPVTGERVDVVEPLPDDLAAAARAAGLGAVAD